MSAGDIVAIAGAGLAGARAAETLRGQGYAGTIVMFGEEATPPYHRPRLSKSLLVAEEPDFATLLVHPENWYRDHEVDLRLGRRITGVDLRDRRLRDAQGGAHPFGKLILTTGAAARRINGCHDDPESRVLVLRSLADASRLRARLATARSLIVVGGGFIGAEVASGAVDLGCSVTMLEAAEGPLRSLGGVASKILADFYQGQGVDLVTSVHVASVREGAAGVTITAHDGRRWEADLVVAGIGVVPADDLALTGGLETGNGVLVDAHGRTSAPFVFAAGDVANRFEPTLGRHIRPEHWQNAQNHAVAVAGNVLGADEPFSEVPWFWSDQFSVNLQMVGLPQDADHVTLRGAPDDRRFSIFYLNGSRVVAVFSMNNARDIAVAKRLISRRSVVDAASIADVGTDLKSLLSQDGRN